MPLRKFFRCFVCGIFFVGSWSYAQDFKILHEDDPLYKEIMPIAVSIKDALLNKDSGKLGQHCHNELRKQFIGDDASPYFKKYVFGDDETAGGSRRSLHQIIKGAKKLKIELVAYLVYSNNSVWVYFYDESERKINFTTFLTDYDDVKWCGENVVMASLKRTKEGWKLFSGRLSRVPFHKILREQDPLYKEIMPIAESIKEAILQKDIDGLVKHCAKELKGSTLELYKRPYYQEYIFGETQQKTPSIYQSIREAKQLRVELVVYADDLVGVYFYDESKRKVNLFTILTALDDIKWCIKNLEKVFLSRTEEGWKIEQRRHFFFLETDSWQYRYTTYGDYEY